MVNILAEIADYLVDQGYANVFAEYKPDGSIPENISINSYQNAAPYGRYGVDYGNEQIKCQVSVRRKTYAASFEDAVRVRNALNSGAEQTPIQLKSCIVWGYPNSSVYKADWDNQNCVTHKFNLSIVAPSFSEE